MDLRMRSSRLSFFMTSSKSPRLFSNGLTAAAITSFRPREGGLSAKRFLRIVGPCAAFSLLVVVVAPWIGSTGVTWHHVLAGISPDREIFVVARLPRTLFAAIAGGALAMAGGFFSAPLPEFFAPPLSPALAAGPSFGAGLAGLVRLVTAHLGDSRGFS